MLKNPWSVGIITGIIVLIISYGCNFLYSYFNIFPKIEQIDAKISRIDSNISDLKLCIKTDNNKGKLIRVGVNKELPQNLASCFSTNIEGFNQYDRILMRYEGCTLKSNPQVEVQIYNIEKSLSIDNRLFVNKEIANQLGIPHDKMSDVYFKIIEKAKSN